MCDVRDCVSSAKSAVIVFDIRSDVYVEVTVPSLPKESEKYWSYTAQTWYQ